MPSVFPPNIPFGCLRLNLFSCSYVCMRLSIFPLELGLVPLTICLFLLGMCVD
eukprot:m.779606 g.779606  ORF g.779606 m.779606 type:complete len:53 (+) comp59134_c0_seq4:76-234(+)